MADKPNRYAAKLAEQLLPDPESRAAFLAALAAGRSAQPALLWCQERPEGGSPFPCRAERPAWVPETVDVLAPEASALRPGQHALHQAGAYYCLDLSSVFEAVPLTLVPAGGVVVDLCAAPGGKSVLAHRLVRPAQLIANEVIGKRVGALVSNLSRCQIAPVEVTRREAGALADALGPIADVLLVDAPCSGQSLLARGKENPGCFHPVTVGHNAGRQRRIIAEAAGLVAPGGYLLYTTCTFSRDENEGVVGWFLEHNPTFAAVAVPALEAHRSPALPHPTYRLWPHEGAGAGGFAALLQLQKT